MSGKPMQQQHRTRSRFKRERLRQLNFHFVFHLLLSACSKRWIKRTGRLSSRRQSRAPALARQSHQRSRRRSFKHKECFTESASHSGKAVFFSKERASRVCGNFCSCRLTWV